MKKTMLILTIVASLAFGFAGCTYDSVQVHHDKIVTNSVPMKAFNDETYIWESWWFGTNKVDKLD